MPWLQVSLTIPVEAAPEVEAVLETLGSSAITYMDAADQPLYEPPPGDTPLWSMTRVSGLFEVPDDINAFVADLRQRIQIDQPWECFHETLEDQDWERIWMRHFKPMQFGERFWVIPDGFEVPDPEAINLLLDPGLAFGTGTHETTALCLKWLAQHPLQGKTVIDYGCGSGILAIAAALCGAARVIAIDIDPQALLATRQNAEKNHVRSQIEVFEPDEITDSDLVAAGCDILVANILAGPLIELAPKFARYVNPDGILVLSGILDSQKESVKSAYEHRFPDIECVLENEWVRLVCRR